MQRRKKLMNVKKTKYRKKEIIFTNDDDYGGDNIAAAL